MIEVQAWQDEKGNLHKTRRDAAVSDFITMFSAAWHNFSRDPRDTYGDSLAIARQLAWPSSRPARDKLILALQYLNDVDDRVEPENLNDPKR